MPATVKYCQRLLPGDVGRIGNEQEREPSGGSVVWAVPRYGCVHREARRRALAVDRGHPVERELESQGNALPVFLVQVRPLQGVNSPSIR